MNMKVLEETERDEFVSPAFLVPKGNSSFRMVIDLRRLNGYTRALPFKMETLQFVATTALPEDQMIIVDIKDGYYALEMHPEDRHYMVFRMAGTLYQMRGLPMGWSASAFYFTKLMQAFMKTVQQPTFGSPIRGLQYLDDLLLFVRTPADVRTFRRKIEGLGFMAHPTKSKWTMGRRVTYLGIVIDLDLNRFELPREKIERLRQQAGDLLQRASKHFFVPVRDLASFAGLANFAGLALPAARFFLRRIYNELGDWNGNREVRLTRGIRSDLHWWRNIPRQRIGRDIFRPTTSVLLEADAATNGKEAGWGAVINRNSDNERRTSGRFSENEAKEHIMVLELRAVKLALMDFVEECKARNVRLLEDNQVVVAILKTLTTKHTGLMSELRRFLEIAWRYDIAIHPEYIRSHDNDLADELSRQREERELRLTDCQFAAMTRKYRISPSIDWFATAINAKCRRFASLDGRAPATYMDAFIHDWGREIGLFHPPRHRVAETLQKIIRERAPGIVAVPYRPGTTWWPVFLLATGRTFSIVSAKTCRPLFLRHPAPSAATAVGRTIYN